LIISNFIVPALILIIARQRDLIEEDRGIELRKREQERDELIAELTSKNEVLESFTYTVSHDLKSPLVTIKGFLGYLEKDIKDGNIQRLRDDSARISNAVEKMQALLSDLLELSRIGRFINPPESVSFNDLADEAVRIVDGVIRQRGVKIQVQPNLPEVHVDRQRVIEVLQNLVDNSAKYMGEQVNPVIEIGGEGEEDGFPIFYVRDNGIGIAPEFHERIFGLFNKLDAFSDGTGIGLTLVRRIIEFHGGRIWVGGEVGRGAVFYFTLPAAGKITPKFDT